MPNIKSAAKRAELARVRTLRNSAIKSRMKTAIRKFNAALASQDKQQAWDSLIQAVIAIDKAQAQGTIHKNAAARYKSGLYRRYNSAIQ